MIIDLTKSAIVLVIGFLHNIHALLCIFAPLGTAKIYLWIKYEPPALSALKFRFILEKLYNRSAAGTFHFKNIFRLPKSLVLSGTPEHNTSFIIVPI